MIEVLYDVESPALPSVDVLDRMGGAARAACALHGISDAEVSLSCVSPPEIRELNAIHRGIDSVTDVLSFPQYDEDSNAEDLSFSENEEAVARDGSARGVARIRAAERCAHRGLCRVAKPRDAVPSQDFPEPPPSQMMFKPMPVMLGDIVICTERAVEQAGEYGHSTEREFLYLFVHGLLHLFGYDHEDDGERAEMRAVEEDVLRKTNDEMPQQK